MPDMTDDAPRSRFDSVAVLLGALALILAIASVVQSARNRTLQVQVAEGQAKLAKAQTMANLDNSLVQLMAKTAADKNDGALRDLLARNGVTFKAPPAPAPEAEAGK
jgi:3-methyladenine DNA glycosylase Mpg